MMFVILGIMIAIVIVGLSALAGMLDTHFAYFTHSGASAYEACTTAGYGTFVVPQGAGRWLYAVHAEAATAASASRVKFSMKEWDGEDIIIPIKDAGSRDPNDFVYLKKPRFMPGGGSMYIYALHGVNEALYISALMSDGASPIGMDSYKGESRMEEMTSVVNSVANTWTETLSYKAPATRGPHAIVGGWFSGTGPKIGRLVIPQMPNGFRPPIFSIDTPIAGTEGSLVGRTLEPIPILANETIMLEVFATGAAATTGGLELVAQQGRAAVTGTVTTTNSGPQINGKIPRSQDFGGRLAAATAGLMRR